MSGWLWLMGLMLAWWLFCWAVWLCLQKWLGGEGSPIAPDWDEFEDEPRLVSACRELSDLAAKTKEASHG